MELHSINQEQRLYVLKCGTGFTCNGFDYADKRARAVAAWMRRPDLAPSAPLGPPEHFAQCAAAMDAGAAHSRATGARCDAELEPQLRGLEGKRVEVTEPSGDRRRFIVGKSTGWMPCHLEIARRNSSGGPAVYLPKDSFVRVVNRA